MRATSAAAVLLLATACVLGQGSPPGPQLGTEMFVTHDYNSQVTVMANWDNLVLETLDGQVYTFEYDQQVPIPGAETEPYNGSQFAEGPYRYESLFVDFVTDSISGATHHHPIPMGGNPGGHTLIHDPMCIRIYRLDGAPFRMVGIDYLNSSGGFRVGTQAPPSTWAVYPVVLGDPLWNTLRLPLLTDVADGRVGQGQGGPYDVLTVNHSAGGAERRVDAGMDQPITFGVLQPPTLAVPAHFLLFAFKLVPTPAQGVTLPLGLGELCFPIGYATMVGDDPDSFLLASTVDLSAVGILAATLARPTPWSFTHAAGISVPAQLTLQAIVQDGPASFAVSNAVTLRVM